MGPDPAGQCGVRRSMPCSGGRLSEGGSAQAQWKGHRFGRSLAMRGEGGPASSLDPGTGEALGSPGGGIFNPRASRAPSDAPGEDRPTFGEGQELGEQETVSARFPARRGIGCSQEGASFDLGGRPGPGAVGARQPGSRQGTHTEAFERASIHPRSYGVVPSLPEIQSQTEGKDGSRSGPVFKSPSSQGRGKPDPLPQRRAGGQVAQRYEGGRPYPGAAYKDPSLRDLSGTGELRSTLVAHGF
jgi:hypothetical protein